MDTPAIIDSVPIADIKLKKLALGQIIWCTGESCIMQAYKVQQLKAIEKPS